MKKRCEWNATACVNTVQWNYLNVLKWLRGIDRDICELESDETEICPWDVRVCIHAVAYKRIDVLAFALENGCEFGAACHAAVLELKDPAIVNYVNNHFA